MELWWLLFNFIVIYTQHETAQERLQMPKTHAKKYDLKFDFKCKKFQFTRRKL